MLNNNIKTGENKMELVCRCCNQIFNGNDVWEEICDNCFYSDLVETQSYEAQCFDDKQEFIDNMSTRVDVQTGKNDE